MSSWSSAAATAVEDRLFRALAVFRAVVLANTVVLTALRSEDVERSGLAVACLLAMAAWSVLVTWAYDDARRRTPLLLVADLAVAVGLLLLTPVVMSDDATASLPGFWASAALLAWAIHYRALGGLGAGAVIAAADLARQDVDRSDYGNAFLLVVGGTILGYMCGSLARMATERDLAERAAAAAEERTRLARAVHDGVLQVLALVQRRGGELGGDAAELGRLAGEQERELRALIRAQDVVTDPRRGDRAGTRDVAAALARLELGSHVTVAGPGTPVELEAGPAEELVAATRACLDNVRVHVGEDAPAWVLLQAFPDRVEVVVRDDGPGIPAGRLDEAAAQGRLGVAESIRGRIADVGGTAEVTSGPDGTTWELVVPRVRSPRVAG